MAYSSIPMIQINLQHSKSASAILTTSTAVVQTCIAIIQEPWLVKGVIKGLGNCSEVINAYTANKIRAYTITKGGDVTLLLQLSSGDLTAVQLRFMLASGTYRHVIVGSVYVPYNSDDLPPQEEVKKFVACASNKGLELLLGCYANSHHEVWGSTDINLTGKSLLDFIKRTNHTSSIEVQNQPSGTQEDRWCWTLHCVLKV